MSRTQGLDITEPDHTRDGDSRCDICLEAGRKVFDFKNRLFDPAEVALEDEAEAEDGGQYEYVSFGTIAQLKNRSLLCHTCRIFAKYITSRFTSLSNDAQCGVRFASGFPVILFEVGGWVFGLLPTEAATQGYSVDTDVFAMHCEARSNDMAKLRGWKSRCTEKHGAACSEDTTSIAQTARPKYLIDLNNARVVSAPINCRWVALSYVWGRVNVTKALKANISMLMQPGALNNPEVEIPATISDAMKLAALMHENYIWVDSLCIVQDDEQTKRDELRKMDSIYRHATFTIIAAEGSDANYGISGVPGGSRPNRPDCDYVELLPGRPVLLIPHDFAHHTNSTWSERAWTYQEAMLSKRIIVCRGLMKWMCSKIAAVEVVSTPAACSDAFSFEDDWTGYIYLDFHPTFSFPTYLDTTQVFMMMADFSTRSLTYQRDAVDAVGGVISALTSSFKWGFHFGLPELIFDIALLWQPDTPLIRRASTPPDTDNDPPSWSYLGWQGEMDFSMCNHASEWEAHDWAHKIFVQPFGSGYEYLSQTPESEGCIIDNSYHLYRKLFIEKKKASLGEPSVPPVPWGWTQIEGCSTGYARYEHPLLSDLLPSRIFPLPLTNDDMDMGPLSRSPILLFDTETTSMTFGDLIEQPRNDSLPAEEPKVCHTSIRTKLGQWAGIMRHNLLAADAPCMEDCQLIALSYCSMDPDYRLEGMHEMDCQERPQPADGEPYEYFNVLWVGTDDDGLMYRKGLGRVVSDVWSLDDTLTGISVRLK